MYEPAEHPVLTATNQGDWYLAYTKPRSEEAARLNLVNQHYEAWLPLIKQIARGRKKQQASSIFVMEPMFPRYLLFRPSTTSQSIFPVKSTVGIARVITLGHQLGTITHQKTVDLARMEQAQHALDETEVLGIKAGMAVVIREGPFRGLGAIVHLTAKERVFLLVQLLGKEQKLALPVTHISKET